MIRIINTSAAQKPIGPYSQAIVAKGFVFCSATAGVDPATNKLAKGLENQTRQIFSNLEKVLHEAGSDLSKVVKVTIFLKNMSGFETVNSIYKEVFTKNFPARTTVEVSGLPKAGALIVAELTAVI